MVIDDLRRGHILKKSSQVWDLLNGIQNGWFTGGRCDKLVASRRAGSYFRPLHGSWRSICDHTSDGVHELALNSLKYGALSSPNGTLDVSSALPDH